MIETTYQLTIDEVVRTGFRRKVLRPRFLASISVLIVAGLMLLTLERTETTAGVLCIALAAALPIGLYVAIRRTASHVPSLTSTTHFAADESGFTLRTSGLQSQFSWSLIRSWSQTPEHLFLYIDQGGSIAVTIPKRAFNSTQLTQFLDYVKRAAI